MLRLLGYTDRLSAAPGDSIRFMVSSDHDEYTSQLVRLVHGDTNPAGPGFKQVLVPSAIDGVRAGRHQDLPSGSSATLPVPAGILGGDLTFAVFVQPTAPGGRESVVASRGRPFDGDGWALVVSETGTLEAVIGRGGDQTRIATEIVLPRWRWCFVALTVEAGVASVSHLPWRDPGAELGLGTHREASGGPIADDADALLLAASVEGDRVTRHFDGRLDRPRLIGRALDEAALLALAETPDDLDAVAADLIGAWDFSLDIPNDRITDVSGHDRHGTTTQPADARRDRARFLRR